MCANGQFWLRGSDNEMSTHVPSKFGIACFLRGKKKFRPK